MDVRSSRFLLVSCCAVAFAGASGLVGFAGPPLPFHDPKVKVREALACADTYLADKRVDLSKEQYIASVVLKHRDNANDDTPGPLGYYWEIRWKLKPPVADSPPKQKKAWCLEVSMDGTVYEGS